MIALRPLSELQGERARRIRAIFTDVDGTLTVGGKLLPSTYAALWRWKEQGGRLVLVTGRSAGWADAFARQWPVDAVVAENGGMAFLCGKRGLTRLYSTPPARLAADRLRLFAAARLVAQQVKGAELSSDSRYTEVDLAVDYNEERHLGEEAATRIEALLRGQGLSAVRSSVHVNFWAGTFDKLSMCRTILRRLKLTEREALYAGDSVNDEPMFRGFTNSVGVANVRDVLERMEHWPAFVTRRREGKGFEEIVRRLLRSSG